MTPPKRLWRVEYLLLRWNGTFEEKQRFYDRSDYLDNMLKSIRKYPDQLRLVSVHRCEPEWRDVADDS